MKNAVSAEKVDQHGSLDPDDWDALAQLGHRMGHALLDEMSDERSGTKDSLAHVWS